jgi:hypothetical protein
MPAIRAITKVDPERRAQWLMPSAIRCVSPEDVHYLLPVDPDATWQHGDLLLGQVEGPVGLIATIQNINRRTELNYREAALFPGSVTAAVLAPRAGTSTCIARVPERPVPEVHLHGVGGQVGIIEPGSGHSALYTGAPTTLKVLALLGGVDQRPLNMRRFGLRVPREPRARTPDDPALILVIGSDMDSGKTTTARRVIYGLRAWGHRVVAGKAGGVASLGDISSMFDAGASEVIDFAVLGEPATIGLPEEKVLDLFHQIFNHLRMRAGRGGFVVIELADGIWYRETRLVLEDPFVRSLVTHVVFACHGILDAEDGMRLIRAWGYGDKLRAISGKLGSSGVLRKAAGELFGAWPPVFDSLNYEHSPEPVAALFT